MTKISTSKSKLRVRVRYYVSYVDKPTPPRAARWCRLGYVNVNVSLGRPRAKAKGKQKQDARQTKSNSNREN